MAFYLKSLERSENFCCGSGNTRKYLTRKPEVLTRSLTVWQKALAGFSGRNFSRKQIFAMVGLQDATAENHRAVPEIIIGKAMVSDKNIKPSRFDNTSLAIFVARKW